MEHFGDKTAIKLDNEHITDCNNMRSFGSGDTHIINNFLSREEADDAFNNLFSSEIEYQQWHHMPSKKNELLPLSRLKIAMANTDSDGWTPHYRFPVNNQNHHGVLPFSKTVKSIMDKLIEHTKIPFNHAVVLLYRDGDDCIGFHKDKTLDLSSTDPIASISLGQERTYMLRNSIHNPTVSQEVMLKHGTLLLLGSKTNEEYYHSIPKNNDQPKMDPRISLTFRVVTTFKNNQTGKLKGQGEKYSDYDWPSEFGGTHIEYPSEILDFWFGKERNQFRSGLWWNGIHPTEPNLRTKPQVDAYITSKWKYLLDKYDTEVGCDLFSDNHYLKSWTNSTNGLIALLILFDQFPRHIYRGNFKSFSFDKYALSVANNLNEFQNQLYLNKLQNYIPIPCQLFIYVAMMHAENITLVTNATYEIYKLANSDNLPETGNNASSTWKSGLIKLGAVSQEHLNVLKKFNRYPHRNPLLNRENTPQETDFLASKKLPYWMRSVLPITKVESKKHPHEFQTESTEKSTSSKLKILVLHSNRQTADSFRAKTERHLEKKLKDIADLTYCNSPQFYEPMGEAKRLIEEAGYTNVPNIGHTRIWWNATDDPNTMVYVGLEQSLEYIESLFKNEQYDGIIGFSQGGTFTGIIASMVHDQRKGKKTFMPLDNISKSLKFVAIISGFYCRDTRPEFRNCLLESLPSAHLPELVVMRKDLIEIPSFHTWGLADTLVNPWRSQKLSEAFDNTKQIHIHQSSHFIQAIKFWPISEMYEWLKTFSEPEKLTEKINFESVWDNDEINETKVSEFSNEHTNQLVHSIIKKLPASNILYKVLQILYKTNDKMYNELLNIIHDDPIIWKHLIDIDTAHFDGQYRKLLVSLMGDELVKDYKKYYIDKALGLPSKLALYAPKYNNVYRTSRLYHEMSQYLAKHINVFDMTKICINEDHEKRQTLLSYNQYRKIISKLTILICPPHDKKQERKHIPKNSLEQLLNMPLNEHILHPKPEPVDISPPELLDPLYTFLQNEAKSETERVFEKGTVCIDGRLDLCKQVIGPIGVPNLLESLRLDSVSQEPKVKHLLLGNNRCGNDLGHAVAKFIKSGQSALTTWYIAGNNLNADGILPVCEALYDDKQVKQLWLKRNPIHLSGTMHIVNMLNCNTYLKVLDLTNTGLLDEGAILLLNNINNTLEYLYLSSNGLTEKTCATISHVNMGNLKQLGLGCNRLKCEGMQYLANVLENPNCKLESLEIASCGVGPLGAKYIADALKINKSIVHLNFGFLKSTNDLGEVPNLLESQGALEFANMLIVNTTLGSLDMIYTAIKQSGISALASVIYSNNRTLAYLNIEQFGTPHNELSREIIRKALQKNRETMGPELLKQIDNIVLPPHLKEIKSVYRIK